MAKNQSRAARKKANMQALQKDKIKSKITLPKPKNTPKAIKKSLTEAPDVTVGPAVMMAQRMDPAEPEAEPPVQAVEIAPGQHQFPLFRGSKELVQADLW